MKRRLMLVQAGGRFDEITGEPESWQTPLRDLGVHEWSRQWLAVQWHQWPPQTRTSATEALASFITIAVEYGANTPEGPRVYVYSALSSDSESGRDVQYRAGSPADTGLPTIVIYDAVPGGAGVADLAFDAADRHLHATLESIAACPCLEGCPTCVQSPKCGNGNEHLDKAAALQLLRAILG